MRILVLQWAHPGRQNELREVEDHLTAIARRHGDVVRDVAAGLDGFGGGERPPDEVHLVEFADDAAFRAFLADPDRAPWRDRLTDVLEHTSVWRLGRLG